MMLRFLLVLILLVVAMAGGAAAGAWYERDEGIEVTVREGAPDLEDGVDAILTVDARLIAQEVASALEDANLPFAFEVTDVDTVAEGLRVTGRARLSVGGVDGAVRIVTTAIPRAADDGGLAVALADTSVEGLRLPGELEDALADLISDEMSSQTRIAGYDVRRIETSEDQYIVYFARSE